MPTLNDLLNGQVLHVSCHADNKVLSLHAGAWSSVDLVGARGIAVKGDLTAVAGDEGITYYHPAHGRKLATTHLNGLAAHELVYENDGTLIVAGAQHSSLLEVTPLGLGPEPRFRPAETELSTDGRSWLNGLAVEQGRVRYATALGVSNTPDGWRDKARASQGVVIDVADGRTVIGGLLMPHSPRVHAGAVYALNSGHGQLLRWVPGEHQAVPVATLHGFARGLCILGDHALVGVSQGRISGIPELTTDPLSQPGIAVIDLRTGEQVDFARLDVHEVFDVQVGTAPLAV